MSPLFLPFSRENALGCSVAPEKRGAHFSQEAEEKNAAETMSLFRHPP